MSGTLNTGPIRPYPKQKLFLTCKAKQILYGGARGGGKAQSLSSPVLTPFGYRPMGSLKVGDMVSNPDGGVSTIIGVFPQGPMQLYKITFNDGTSTRATGDHLWLVRNAGGKTKSQKQYIHNDEDCRKWRVATTKQLIEQIGKGPNGHASNLPLIPLTKPIRFCLTNRYPAGIDPYLLGLILGDGCISGERIYISSKDIEIQKAVEDFGFRFIPSSDKDNRCPEYSAVGGAFQKLRADLIKLKLMGTKSATKFIPKQYLYASIESRKELLSGLLDTDGYVESSGKLYYTTVSKQLAEDVRFLVESLGGWCSITTKTGAYKKNGETIQCVQAFTLYIQIPDRAELFRIKRKQNRAKKYQYNGGHELFRKIVSIEEDGIEEAQCISVDHPNSLYLTDNFIVTHNTFAVQMKIHQHHELYGNDASILVLRRTLKELTDFIKNARKILGPMGWEWREGKKMFINQQTGCEMVCNYLETDSDAEKYQGHGYTLIIIEEAGNFPKPDPIKLLFGAMRSGVGVPSQMIMTANPGGPGNDWLREQFVEPAPDGFEMIPIPEMQGKLFRYFIPSTMDDNPELMKNDPEYEYQVLGSGASHLVKAWRWGDWWAAPNGNVFKSEWFEKNTYTGKHNYIQIVHSWDTAYKTGAKNDRSANTIWGVLPKEIHLLNCFAGKLEFPELKAKAEADWKGWGGHAIYIEDKASGQSLLQELRRETAMPVRAVQTDTDKLARAWAVSSIFESGIVKVPAEDYSWKRTFIDELCAFPKGAYDDIVDSASQGVSKIILFQSKLENSRTTIKRVSPQLFEV